MRRSRKAQFLGFSRGLDDDPPMLIFWVESIHALADLRYNHGLRGELVVVLSPYVELTSGDFFDTFPASRERNAGRIARAEFDYTNAVESSGRHRHYEVLTCSVGEEEAAVEREARAKPAGREQPGREQSTTK